MSRRTAVLAGLLVTLLLAGVLSYYASGDPDGLTKVAADKGFDAGQKEHPLADSPLAGYRASGVDGGRLSGGLAGVVGVGVTFLVVGGLVLAVRRGGPRSAAPTDDAGEPNGGHRG